MEFLRVPNKTNSYYFRRAFYRAILVSPLDVATGEPIDHHPLAVPVAE